MATWIFPSNPLNYDVDQGFEIDGLIEWYQVKMTKNVQTGDTVYLYISTPAMEIHWKSVVGEVGFYIDKYNNRYYSSSSIPGEDTFIELIPTHHFECLDLVSYSCLKDHGLRSRLMGPQKIDKDLEDYLIDIESMESDPNKIKKHLQSISQTQLLQLARKYSSKQVKTTTSNVVQYYRNPYIAQYAKIRANGVCELCGNKAPFFDKNNVPYLESHHIIWLSKGGADSADNVSALCPNCHKRMHVLDDSNDINYLLNKRK